MLDSGCANACALNGLPGPMRHWFTGFTHSLTPRIHTRKIMGADCAVSSLEIGGLYCEPSTQSLGEKSIRMATACEKGGQENKHMGHKN